MNKKFLFFIVGVIIIGVAGMVVAWIVPRRLPGSTHPSALRVTASFYPLADFAKQVGGDRVLVTNLTPAGAEPHDFDPSPRDVATLQTSSVFIYNGASLEAWVDRVLPDLEQRGVVIVAASHGIDLRPGTAAAARYDPHFWLDPVLASQEVETIKNSFMTADPANVAWYAKNAAAYQEKLQQLDQAFRRELAHCARRDIVTSHAAFGYLAREYQLTVVPLAGVSPDEEPSPQRLGQIAQFAEQHHIEYIFFETLVSPRLAQTIAQEIGARTIVFDPLEGLSDTDIKQGKDYISVQHENLQHLKTALACQ